ncbi:DNA cytosine methyltransferase [Beggiatoa alba]|nr:DNA (cytosine-5-)-methyltransferase [Beggiatoa alba]
MQLNCASFESYTPSVIELFAGAGGLALGLALAGFDTKAVLENNKWACATLRKNRPDWYIIEDDILSIADVGISKSIKLDKPLDLLSGGYPCQAFSYAGKKLGLEDTRGTLFYSFAEILKELQPNMFLAENVKGLVSHDKGRTLETMLNVFKEVGYQVYYKILNAIDYEVAQKRERIVIIGVRNDVRAKIGFDYTFPKPLCKKLTLRDVLQNVPDSLGASYNEKKKAIFALIPQGGCWRDLPDEIAREYLAGSYHLGGGKTGIARRMSWDEAGLTVLCSPAQKQTDRCHPDELRPFTVRENARIQSFPDNWEFVGSVAEQYKQIGNAVPVNLAKHIGLSIKQYLMGMQTVRYEHLQLKLHF